MEARSDVLQCFDFCVHSKFAKIPINGALTATVAFQLLQDGIY